jgi:hypothetical protein
VQATFSWIEAPEAHDHDVLRGLLSTGPVGSSPATETCLNNALVGTSASDDTVPAAGGGFWYLVRGSNACGIGSYGWQASHGVPTVPRMSATCP